MYTHSEVKTFQSVLKPLVDHGAINNEIYMVALKAVKDNINASISPEKSQRKKPEDILLTRQEAADYLKCSLRNVDRMLAEEELPCVRFGLRSVRIYKSAITKMLQTKNE